MARKPAPRRPGAPEVMPEDQAQDQWDTADAGDARIEADAKGYGDLANGPMQDPDEDMPAESDGPREPQPDDMPDPEAEEKAEAGPSPEEIAEMIRARVEPIVGRLQRMADDRVGKRQIIEQRWIEDIQQYHGKYDEQTAAELKGAKKSRLFINKTRPITNAMAARIIDLMFPTDDRNWGIGPSPVPELIANNAEAQSKAVGAEIKAAGASAAAQTDVNAAPAAAAAQIEASVYRKAADELAAFMEQARQAANLMQDEIHDHLKACDYQAGCRDVVEDACQIGTGVMKGPVTGLKGPARWIKGVNGQHTLAPQSTTRPSMVWIDPWSFFPDPNVARIQDGEGTLVRHLMNKKALRALGRLPGFDKDALRRLLTSSARGGAPSYLNQLRAINGEDSSLDPDVYQIWEYSGPLEPEEMRDLALAAGDLDTVNELEEVDPLDEVQAVIWFCQGEMISFAIYPMDSGEPTYSVFCLEKDRTSIFGYGVPYMLRDPQKALNAAWRMMMDNSSASAGSQIVVNKDVVEPENGVWEFASRKIWVLKQNIPMNMKAFDVFDIPNHQSEYANIIEIAKLNMDEEASMPAIAQGEAGAMPSQTATSQVLSMNSANVVFRRYVKNFDDDFTTPNIRRMYHHEMQHSDKEHIKGDYEVDARGSSVLLVREMQATNLILIADRFAAHPVFGKMLKPADLLRNIVASHMIAADTLVRSDSEIEEATAAEAEAMAAQTAGPGGPDPAMVERELQLREDELDAKVEIANQDASTRRYVATMERDVKMAQLAEQLNMREDQEAAKLVDAREERAAKSAAGREAITSKERTIAAEIAEKRRMGQNKLEIANL